MNPFDPLHLAVSLSLPCGSSKDWNSTATMNNGNSSYRHRNKRGLLRMPRGIDRHEMGLLSLSGLQEKFWYLAQGSFLPPKGSMSNITGWKLVDSSSGVLPFSFWSWNSQENNKTYLNIQVHVISGTKAPARKPAHCSSNLDQNIFFPKVEFRSNDLSGYEATCLLAPPAHPKST